MITSQVYIILEGYMRDYKLSTYFYYTLHTTHYTQNTTHNRLHIHTTHYILHTTH